MPISRREFATIVTAGLGALTTAGAQPVVTSEAARSLYAGTISIDALANPGSMNVPWPPRGPLTQGQRDHIAKSGLTALNVTVSADQFEATVDNIALWTSEAARYPQLLSVVRRHDDIARAKKDGTLGLIFGFQNTEMLERDLSRVETFRKLGVLIIQLTYNIRNLIGDGCLEEANAGMSAFGRGVVARMNELGVLLDLSHCGQRTTVDGITTSTKPVAVTHSGCAALNPVPRNKPDAIMKQLADRGGVMGIYLMPFLRPSGQPSDDDLLRHIDHAVRVCGEDHVGIGSDLSITPLDLTPEFRAMHANFVAARKQAGVAAPGEAADVFNYVPQLNAPRRLELIADRLASRGYPSARIEKIIGANWLRLFGEVWGK